LNEKLSKFGTTPDTQLVNKKLPIFFTQQQKKYACFLLLWGYFLLQFCFIRLFFLCYESYFSIVLTFFSFLASSLELNDLFFFFFLVALCLTPSDDRNALLSTSASTGPSYTSSYASSSTANINHSDSSRGSYAENTRVSERDLLAPVCDDGIKNELRENNRGRELKSIPVV
jgi:hypothetical protein